MNAVLISLSLYLALSLVQLALSIIWICYSYLDVLIVLRFMGAAALQKYIGSLGGIGTSGVGSSSSYTPKELNKEITPEKVGVFNFPVNRV